MEKTSIFIQRDIIFTFLKSCFKSNYNKKGSKSLNSPLPSLHIYAAFPNEHEF